MKTKKLAFAALSVAAITTCLCLSPCANTADNGDGDTQTHTHTYAAEWSFDDTYHWHAATCGHDVVSDRAEHTYQGGVCTVCGEEQTIVLTEDTDFDALVSDRVTEEEWKNAFAENAFDNVTLHYVNEGHGYDAYYKIEHTENEKLTGLNHKETSMGMSMYTQTTGSERWIYDSTITGEENKFGKFDVNAMPEDMREEYIDVYDNWMTSYTMLCPDLGEFFGMFDYDEELGAYVYKGVNDPNYDGNLKTNSIMENWDTSYCYLAVKIIDGKLAVVQETMTSNPTGNTYFYDYGNTQVTLPEAELVDVSQIM